MNAVKKTNKLRLISILLVLSILASLLTMMVHAAPSVSISNQQATVGDGVLIPWPDGAERYTLFDGSGKYITADNRSNHTEGMYIRGRGSVTSENYYFEVKFKSGENVKSNTFTVKWVAETCQSVTRIDVTSIPTPMVDQYCSTEGVVITTTPANSTNLMNIYWYDCDDKRNMESTDKFVLGHEYKLCIKLAPKTGYIFKSKVSPYSNENHQYTGYASFDIDSYSLGTGFNYTDQWGNLTVRGDSVLPQIPVTSVALTNVPSVVAGQPCYLDKSLIGITTTPANSVGTVDICWWDETDQCKRTYTDNFEIDHEYSLRAEFFGASKTVNARVHNHVFLADPSTLAYTGTTSVNGQTATAKKLGSTYKDNLLIISNISKVTSSGVVTNTGITRVDITGMETPVEGQYCTTTGITVVTTPAGAATVDAIYWLDETAGNRTSPTDKFVADHKYSLAVKLLARNGYAFNCDGYNSQEYYGAATVNGEKAQYAGTPEIAAAAGKLGVYSNAIKPLTAIKTIEINGVYAPVTGDPCASHTTYTVNPSGSVEVNSHGWYDFTDKTYVDHSDNFIEGHKYYYYIDFLPKSGYGFALGPANSIGNRDYLGTAKVNGKKAGNALKFYSKADLRVRSEIIVATKPVVTVSDVPTPVAGRSCNTSGISLTTNPADSISSSSIRWWDLTDEAYNDTFTAGHEYCLIIKLVPEPYSVFDVPIENYYESYEIPWSSKVTINGEAPASADFNHVYDPNYDEPETFLFIKSKPVVAQEISLINPFTDVPDGSYYKEPVLWAVSRGITNGTTSTTFSPNQKCTRAQAVTFLWRAAGSPAPTSTYNPFSDVKEGAYYYNAVLWAVEKGITNGTSSTSFSPNVGCNRAQIVTFLWRAMGVPAVASSANPFKDVSADSYYYNAVLWAVANKITNGTTTTTFSPNNTCTRGQIVTFLYRSNIS